MYAINEAVKFTIILEAEFGTTFPTTMDLLFIDPKGASIYNDNGASWGAVYSPGVPPVDADSVGTPGSLIFTRSFNVAGRWNILLTTGTSGSFTTWFTEKINIQSSDPDFTTTNTFRV